MFYRYKILLDDALKLLNEKLEVLKSIAKWKYQIMLYLNPDEKIWDEKIIGLIEELRVKINENPRERIRDLFTITQYLLKFEWEDVKKHLPMTINEKDKLKMSNKYFQMYLSNINQL